MTLLLLNNYESGLAEVADFAERLIRVRCAFIWEAKI